MRNKLLAQTTAIVLGLGTVAALSACDTNYYGDSGAPRSTTTTTVAPAPMPPAATTTTTVSPNIDGSTTTTEKTYRRY